MLSLLSLLLASGSVLRADTERWTPQRYPNPRRNYTACNTWENSTLCDPDHILTDQWRAQINENIQKQMQRLTDAVVPLIEKAPAECTNRTEGVTIYVLLAKRIFTQNNRSITGNDLTNFGDELAKQYGLNELPCKTFLLLIGIEAAKLAYVRTGKDLRLPADLMQRVFHQYKLFNAKSFMAGLNKIVDEIGEQMADPFKELTLSTVGTGNAAGNQVLPNSTSTPSSTTLAEIVAALVEREERMKGEWATGKTVDGEVQQENHLAEQPHGWAANGGGGGVATSWWMFTLLGAAILLAFGSLGFLAVVQRKHLEKLRQQQQLTIRSRRMMMQTVLADEQLGPGNLIAAGVGGGRKKGSAASGRTIARNGEKDTGNGENGMAQQWRQTMMTTGCNAHTGGGANNGRNHQLFGANQELRGNHGALFAVAQEIEKAMVHCNVKSEVGGDWEDEGESEEEGQEEEEGGGGDGDEGHEQEKHVADLTGATNGRRVRIGAAELVTDNPVGQQQQQQMGSGEGHRGERWSRGA